VVTPLDEVEAGYFSAVSYRFTVVNVTPARLLPGGQQEERNHNFVKERT
jgi:hypothetical protein